LLTWVGITVVVGLVGTRFGGDYNDNFELPDTESTTAQERLFELEGGAGTGTGLEGQVVWKPDSGEATTARRKRQ
jgi:microcystin-dependent protein